MIPDIPITVIFLVIYLTFGIVHLKILKSNKGRGHKFIFNGALMGIFFSISKVVISRQLTTTRSL